MRYKITQTLLSSYKHMFDVDAEYFEEAQEDFLKCLRREKREKTQAMQNGIDFENAVYNRSLYNIPIENPDWQEGAEDIANILLGAQVQVVLEKDIVVADTTFHIYGIADAIKCGVIYDVKFLNKSIGSTDLLNKYLESPQHSAYMYCLPEATEFNYLVSDGRDVYIETYYPSETPYIGTYIEEFVRYLKDMNLFDLYKEKWVFD